jgi:hypothetical protein
MALFDDATIKGKEISLFNQQIHQRAVPLGEQATPALTFFTGNMPHNVKNKPKNLGAMPPNFRMEGGRKFDLKFTEKLAQWTGTGYGAGERAAVTHAVHGNEAKCSGVISNYIKPFWLDKADVDDLQGKNFNDKVAFLTQQNDLIALSGWETWDTLICAAKTEAQADNKIGSMLWWLTGDSLFEIDRTDVANANFLAKVSTAATLTLAILRREKTAMKTRLGEKPVVACSTNVYDNIFDKIEAAAGADAITKLTDDTISYGGDYMSYMGMNFVLFHRLPANHAIMTPPDIWAPYTPGGEFMKQFTEWNIDPNRVAQYQAKFEMRGAIICTDPQKATVFTSATG